MNDTAVITSFFNFQNYRVPQRNLRRWLRWMGSQSIPVYGVELTLFAQQPATADESISTWLHLPATLERHSMFQKEALLNIAEKGVPEQYTKLVIMDPDIFIDNPYWLQQTSAMLNHVNACSPFDSVHWTDQTGAVIKSAHSFGHDPTGLYPAWSVHPGFAIALRRDFWRKVGGLHPYSIVGGGDTALCVALAQISPEHFRDFHNPQYIGFHQRVREWVDGIAAISGNCYHEHHGSFDNRKYSERGEWIEGLNIAEHLRHNEHGFLEWTDAAPEAMREKLVEYFRNRREDD